MVHFTGEKSETRWCTLNMAADQKLLDLAGSLLQMIAKTQENLGEMLKIQRRQNEMSHQISRLYWFAKGGEKPSGSNRQGKGRWISDGTFIQANR